MTDEERFREMLDEISIDPGARLKHYDRKNPCFEDNLDQLLDAAEAAFHVLQGKTPTEAYEIVGQRLYGAAFQSNDGEGSLKVKHQEPVRK